MIVSSSATSAPATTQALQSQLDRAAGGVVEIAPGKYWLSATLRVASNTTLRAHGAHFVAASGGFVMLSNINSKTPYASEKVDHDIVVEGGTYDYGSFADGGTHAISMRMARNVTVRNATFVGGNDATAMLACQGTLIENCRAFGQNNCAYDHWEGPQDATVRHCYAFVEGADANGILFTGVGDPGTHLTAQRALFENNSIYGSSLRPCGPGIVINADGAGCSTEAALVSGNQLVNTGGGIVISGSGGHHELSMNYFIECGSSTQGGADGLIRVSPEVYDGVTGSPPTDCVIADHTAVGCSVNQINVALVQLNGTGHTVGAFTLLRTHMAGAVFWCPSRNNRILIKGPITADAETIRGVASGLYVGDRSTVIETSNPWRR